MNSNSVQQEYNRISKEYSDLAVVDPSKKYVQYPSAIKLLGDITYKTILDIGCGDGIFARQLANLGARVTGYDISDKFIVKAKEIEKLEPHGIAFEIANPNTFKKDVVFDKAVSVMVLLYAKDKEDLKKFFSSAFDHLKKGSEFVSITFNPNFKRNGEIVYNRRFSKTDNGKMKVEFFNDENKQTFSALFTDFSVLDYEQAAKSAGFKELCWKKLEINEEGMKDKSKEFWNEFEDDYPYVGLVVHK